MVLQAPGLCSQFQNQFVVMHVLVEDAVVFTYSFGHCELGLVDKGGFHFPSDFDLLGPFQGLVNLRISFFPFLVKLFSCIEFAFSFCMFCFNFQI